MRDVVPDLIILDLHMPEMDGPTFLKALEDAPVLRRIRCSSCPASWRTNPPRASLGLNIVGRLAKPLALADSLADVQAALAPGAARPGSGLRTGSLTGASLPGGCNLSLTLRPSAR